MAADPHPSNRASRLQTGDRIGPYIILDVLGSGDIEGDGNSSCTMTFSSLRKSISIPSVLDGRLFFYFYGCHLHVKHRSA